MGDGFEIVDNYDVQDLTENKQDSNLLPVTKNLKVRISKAGIQENKAKDIFSLKLELRIVDGIINAEGVPQFINKPLFTGIMDLVYGAKNAETRDKEGKKWWKSGQHLVGFKQFCTALDIPLTGIKINDAFLGGLIDKELLIDIKHEADTAMDADGNRVATGTFRERISAFKKVV